MRPYSRRHSPPFPHRRELEISYQSGATCNVLFDKGMDFLQLVTSNLYKIMDETYLVITYSQQHSGQV